MLLIVQLVLTYQAWKKGWRAWALLPIGIDLVVGMLIGSVIESIDQAIIPCMITGLLSIGALIAMTTRKPHPVQVPAQSVPVVS